LGVKSRSEGRAIWRKLKIDLPPETSHSPGFTGIVFGVIQTIEATFMITVTAAILIHENKFLIARRKSSIRHAGKWEFPGGKLEIGETPEQCLTREIKEEFSIEISVDRFFCESTYTYNRGAVHVLSYVASWLSGEITPVDHDDYVWAVARDLLEYDLLPADIPLAKKIMDTYLQT
jgi:8-oxo-dGTP diphosphatase